MHFKRLLPLVAFAVMAGSARATINGNVLGLNLPDQFGGYTTEHILVRFERGVFPIDLGFGRFTTLNKRLDHAFASWQVTGVRPCAPFGFADKELADELGLSRTYVVNVPKGTDTLKMAQAINKLDGVELAEIDGIGGVALVPNDPQVGNCWGLNNTGQTGGTVDADIDAFEAWDRYVGTSEIILAVVDTGIDGNHPEMAGKQVPGWNTNANNNYTYDNYGHGTHCAGTAGANSNNSIGLAGVSWGVRIMPIRVLNNGGGGTEAQCGDGIVWATDNGAQICTMSLQYYTGSTYFRNCVDYAFNKGVLLIAANGNSAGNNIAFPAKFANCYGVGATTHRDQIASFSNYGPECDVSAPGENVYSCIPNNGYAYYSGTSMATPHTSGLASLLWSYDRGMKNTEVFEAIRSTAEDKGNVGWDQWFGWGRINAKFALDKVHSRLSPITAINVVRGTVDSGGVNQLFLADDQRLNIKAQYVAASVEAPVTVEFTGTLVVNPASSLEVQIERSGTLGNLDHRVQLFNFQTSTYETLDASVLPTTDKFSAYRTTGAWNRFISGNTFKMRVTAKNLGPVPGPWTVRFDQVRLASR
jgi:subtilisin family serine protease